MAKPTKCKPLVENVMMCTLCGGQVDRFEHAFQCRDCGALGSLMYGIMVKLDYSPEVEESDGEAD